MEDLTQNWSQLTLSDREGPGCNLTKDDSSMDFTIASKFLTKRALNVEVIARTFNPLWRARNGFKIQNLGDLCWGKILIPSMSMCELKLMTTKQ